MFVRHTSLGRLTALIAAVLLASAPLAAQQQQAGQDVEFQSFRLPGWSFTPSIAIGTIYDSNVALVEPPASVGEAQDDTFFTVMPGGQLEYLGKRSEFSANYRGFVRRYFDLEGLNGFDQHAGIGFKRAMSRRLTLFAKDTFVDSPTTDEVDLNGAPFRLMGSRRNTLAAGTAFRITKFTNWNARYDLTWVDFERPDVLLTGGYIHSLRNEVNHQLNERLRLGGEHAYRTASLDEGTRTFDFQDVGGVAHFVLNATTTASAAAGFALMRDHQTDDTRTGPYFRLGIEHALDRATVGAAFERQYVPTFGFGGVSSSRELRGFVAMPLARSRAYTQASASWRRSIPFEELSLQLDTIILRSIVGFSATRWARVEGVYTYTRQDSIVTGGEVDRHRIGAQLVISQPMRIR